MSKTLLIDADVLIFQASVSVEQEVDWGNDLWTLHADLGEAKDILNTKIDELCETFPSTTSPIMALSDITGQYFRKKIFQGYKAGRTGKRKPIVFRPLRTYLEQQYNTYVKPGLEGDDVLGILATHPKLVKGDRLVVSIDKDMGTIPCNWSRDGEEYITVTEEEADYSHMIQTLTGDSTDSYGGCPGIGPKRATVALEGLTSYDEMWPVVVNLFYKAGLAEHDALLQARLARILRAEDYDFMRKEPILWTPPSR